MRTSYFPSTDSGLLAWSLNLTTRINQDPEAFGLTPLRCAEYQAAHDAYALAYAAAASPATRNQSAVIGKNAARATLKEQARRIVSLINGDAGVTDQQKIELGLTVRKNRSAIAPPETTPNVHIVSMDGHTIRLRLSDSGTIAGTRPASAAGAKIFSFIGDEPASALSEWSHFSTTRRRVEVTFPTSVPPGSRVWFCACWWNPRAQDGPTGTAVGAWIQFGGSMVMGGIVANSSRIQMAA